MKKSVNKINLCHVFACKISYSGIMKKYENNEKVSEMMKNNILGILQTKIQVQCRFFLLLFNLDFPANDLLHISQA